MKTIEVERKEIDVRDFKLRSALESDFETLISGSCVVIDKHTKEILVVYVELDLPDNDILWALDRIKYDKSERTSGPITTSKTFGFLPRNPIRKDYCTPTALATKQPVEHAVVCKYGMQLSQLYSENNPELYQKHQEIMKEKILDEYAMRDTPFTSGIINKNNPLKYHYDAGNFKGVYSCMAVFKRDVQGGYLSCPEYNIGFELKHNSAFMFEGQSMLHGVTPIRKSTPKAARYSIVYYSMQQIWNCLPLTEEVARIRQIKTEREMKRYKRLVAEKAEATSGSS